MLLLLPGETDRIGKEVFCQFLVGKNAVYKGESLSLWIGNCVDRIGAGEVNYGFFLCRLF